MTQKKFSGIPVYKVLLAVLAVLGLFFFLFNRYMPSDITASHERSIDSNRIHGRIIYDQRTALPPQAMLVVQLAARKHSGSSQKIIAEIRKKLTSQIPVDFTLPVIMDQLDRDHAYSLHARISVGDTLWFVNEIAMPVEPERSAYLIRLSMVEGSNSEMSKKDYIRDVRWNAEDILGKGVIDNSHITLHIDGAAKTASDGDGDTYTVNGSGGCNRYFTKARLNDDGHTLRFEPPGMTFMACAEAIMVQEAQFADMMSKVRAYSINQPRQLHLLDENDNILARFVPAD